MRAVASLAARRVDDAGDVPAGGEDVTHGPAKQLGDAPRRIPRHDVVLLTADRIGILADAAQIDRFTLQLDLAGLDQIVLDVGIAQVPTMRSPGHARAVAVPIQKV